MSAAVVVTPLLKKLAGELIKEYKGKIPDDLMPNAGELATGLANMIADNTLDLGGTTAATAFKKEMLDIVRNVATKFQQDSENRFKVDGIIGRRMLNLLNAVRKCDREAEKVDITKLPKVPEAFDARDVRYFIKGNMPPLDGGFTAAEVISMAWRLWIEVADIRVMKATRETGANVIISLGNLDGQPGGMLGRAHVGPPGDRQLQVTFDVAEQWSALKFQATTCHEFGHILGLRHGSSGFGDLMTTHFDPANAVARPQAGDIRAIQAIWGPPRP
jgi:hypothetical protein